MRIPTPFSSETRWLRIARLSAGLMIIGLLAALWVASVFGEFQVCKEVVAHVGTRPVVRSCGPPSLSDFAAGWIIVVLMLPEVSEVVVAGLFSFKRYREARE